MNRSAPASLAVKLALTLALALGGCAGAGERTLDADPLPSWNDGAAKQAIVGFVDRVTEEGSADFVPVDQRIATFDNDGTLWAEQPIYVQFAFAIDRVKALAPEHPEWRENEPLRAGAQGELHSLAGGGGEGG